MSAILKKRVCFWPKYSHFLDKGGLFSPYATASSTKLHFVEKGSLLSPQKSVFCRIRVSFECSKISVLEKRGHFLDEKVSGKGSLLILENDHTSYRLHLSGGTGTEIHSIISKD